MAVQVSYDQDCKMTITGVACDCGCEHRAVFAAGVRRAQRPAQDGACAAFVAAERFLVVADRELDRAQAGVVLDHDANLKALSGLDVLRCFDADRGCARRPRRKCKRQNQRQRQQDRQTSADHLSHPSFRIE